MWPEPRGGPEGPCQGDHSLTETPSSPGGARGLPAPRSPPHQILLARPPRAREVAQCSGASPSALPSLPGPVSPDARDAGSGRAGWEPAATAPGSRGDLGPQLPPAPRHPAFVRLPRRELGQNLLSKAWPGPLFSGVGNSIRALIILSTPQL